MTLSTDRIIPNKDPKVKEIEQQCYRPIRHGVSLSGRPFRIENICRLIGKKVAERVRLFGGCVKRIADFQLHPPGEFAALAGTGDHFMRDLLSRGGDKVVMR